MLSKLKFSVKDLIIGLIIISPLVLIVISSFHPIERRLEKEDERSRGVINSLSKAALLYKEKTGEYPANAQALNSGGIIDWTPEEPEKYIFKSDGQNLIIYTAAKSLSWREYCLPETTNILFSSKNSRTDFVCGDNLAPGNQTFVN